VGKKKHAPLSRRPEMRRGQNRARVVVSEKEERGALGVGAGQEGRVGRQRGVGSGPLWKE
jgi:hypothetical protein